MIERIICAIRGHKYVVEKEFIGSRKVGCTCCGKKWGMHDATKSFIPWDDEIEEMYKFFGDIKWASTYTNSTIAMPR